MNIEKSIAFICKNRNHFKAYSIHTAKKERNYEYLSVKLTVSVCHSLCSLGSGCQDGVGSAESGTRRGAWVGKEEPSDPSCVTVSASRRQIRSSRCPVMHSSGQALRVALLSQHQGSPENNLTGT